MTPADISAKPAYPGIIDYVQPDGSTIQIILQGDENYHQTLTPDGTPLQRNAEGFLVPVPESARKNAPRRKEQKKYLFSGSAFPAEGSPRALVVLAEFVDKKFSMSNPKDFYNRLINEEGFSDYGANGSARDFFVSNSKKKFSPQFDVYGPVALPQSMSYYGENDMWQYDVHPELVCIEACRQLDTEVDFSIYDSDGDGLIDNVFIYYAGYGEADSGLEDTIWPHSADLRDFELGMDYAFDGVILNRYAMSNEIDYQYKRPDGVGTFIHEFSHVLGLPDLYNTTFQASYTPGEYSTLDYGPYNNKGLTPPYYSIYERYSLGWLTPKRITESGYYTLAPIHAGNEGFIIPTEKEDEFFLIENRQQRVWDKYIPGHGMIIWHIDFDQDIWDKNIVNNTASHQYVDLVEADGKAGGATKDADTFPGTGGITSISFETTPALRSWGKKQLEVLAIEEIKEGFKDSLTFYARVNPNSGVDNIGADGTGAYSVSGRQVSNESDSEAIVADITGSVVAQVAPGATVALEPGLYIVYGKEGSVKAMIR